MCGRFALKESPKNLAEHFRVAGHFDCAPSWNIAPSMRIVSITADHEEKRHVRMMRWGLIPSWAKDATIGNKLNNARGETVAEKPSFRNAFKTRRCLIPASGFYEWKMESGIKQPWYISYKSGEPMAFAGLWEEWKPSDGEAIQTCCIITTEANAIMQPIHDRMPVILNPDQWEQWLSHEVRRADLVQPLIAPHDSESMQAWPVTRDLNRAGLRNDAGLTEPLARDFGID
ncbi:MAG: SOS response-associated peptidase [Sideroxydans sp.]|jgi:putative SOS response-associated peptidase YedK